MDFAIPDHLVAWLAAWKKEVRRFVAAKLRPHDGAIEESGEIPPGAPTRPSASSKERTMTPSDDTAPVLVARENSLAVLTLNRPQAYNAMNLELSRALLDALVDCDEDAGVRAVMITGADGREVHLGLRGLRAQAGRAGPDSPRLEEPQEAVRALSSERGGGQGLLVR